MCYDIKVLHETALKRARRKNDPELMQAIEKELESYKQFEYHHVSGFAHPRIPIYTNFHPNHPKPLSWGLIPDWIKDESSAKKIQNSTINARYETLYEKPAFRNAAKHKRCLIFVDGFYETHYVNSKGYPHYIHSKDKKELCLAGIWEDWTNKETGELYSGFSIVTRSGIGLMKKLHNNPKIVEPRMPLILDNEAQEKWLSPDFTKKDLQDLLSRKEEIPLQSHTVKRLRGKEYLGNIPEVSAEYVYNELSNIIRLDF
ncbi:MAG: SOS response-associated peptidase [Bacteroidales bacterium]|nr:SOS response-associated peptidase [Bacteroidales bacterium]